MSFSEFFRGIFPRKPVKTATVSGRRNDGGDVGYPIYLHNQAVSPSDKHESGHHGHGTADHGHSHAHHSDGGWGGGDSGGGGGDGGGGGGGD